MRQLKYEQVLWHGILQVGHMLVNGTSKGTYMRGTSVGELQVQVLWLNFHKYYEAKWMKET
jgi:hypothetical protein